MIGERVIVYVPTETGRDDGNNPIIEFAPLAVENVLVAPGANSDVDGSIRPDGVRAQWVLHFPKTCTLSLRGCLVSVRGGEPLPVVGDPQAFAGHLTPTPWDRPVALGFVEG